MRLRRVARRPLRPALRVERRLRRVRRDILLGEEFFLPERRDKRVLPPLTTNVVAHSSLPAGYSVNGPFPSLRQHGPGKGGVPLTGPPGEVYCKLVRAALFN